MKNIIIISLLNMGNVILAQDYIPMLGNTNEWNIIRSFETTYTEKYYTNGTLSFEDELYRIVYHAGYKTEAAYIREDTIEKKIYTRGKYSDKVLEEVLLYDFSLNEKDTIELYNWEWGMGYIDTAGIFVLDSIRTVNTQIDTRNIFYLTSTSNNTFSFPYSVTWVEGIGTLGHFFNPGYYMLQGDKGLLSCFYKNGVHVYQSPDYETCELSIGINNRNKNDLNLYPNPWQNTLIIENTGLLHGTIFIFNTMGQVIFQKTLQGTEKEELDLSHLPKGMYIVKVSNGHKSYSEIVLKE